MARRIKLRIGDLAFHPNVGEAGLQQALHLAGELRDGEDVSGCAYQICPIHLVRYFFNTGVWHFFKFSQAHMSVSDFPLMPCASDENAFRAGSASRSERYDFSLYGAFGPR